MSWFKNRAQTMTPPPGRDGDGDAENSAPGRAPASSASINELVSKLITPDAVNSLKQIARQGDGYKVATQIQTALETIRPKNKRDARHIRSIGFELVGDLYMKHLRKCIANLEEKDHTIGPNIFRGYCLETLDAYFLGDHVKVGVEGIIALTDSLLFRAVGADTNRALLISLAEEGVRTLAQAAEEYCETVAVESRREARGARKKSSSNSSKRTSSSTMGRDLRDYIQSVDRTLRLVAQEFRSVSTAPPTNIKEIKNNRNAATFAKHLEYFEDIMAIEHRKAYRPYSAAVKTHVGFLREHWRKGSGRAFFRGAARDYEKQADLEFDLSLMRLYKARLLEARILYLRAGLKDEATRVEQMF